MEYQVKKIDEEQAWAVLQVVFGARYGLCHAIDELLYAGLISRKVASALRAPIEACKNQTETRFTLKDSYIYAYLWPGTTTFKDEARIQFIQEQRARLKKPVRKRKSTPKRKPAPRKKSR